MSSLWGEIMQKLIAIPPLYIEMYVCIVLVTFVNALAPGTDLTELSALDTGIHFHCSSVALGFTWTSMIFLQSFTPITVT